MLKVVVDLYFANRALGSSQGGRTGGGRRNLMMIRQEGPWMINIQWLPFVKDHNPDHLPLSRGTDVNVEERDLQHRRLNGRVSE